MPKNYYLVLILAKMEKTNKFAKLLNYKTKGSNDALIKKPNQTWRRRKVIETTSF